MATKKTISGYTLSGPGVEKGGYASTRHAISAGLTEANRSRADGDATFYIRDASGVRTAWVERDGSTISVFCAATEAA